MKSRLFAAGIAASSMLGASLAGAQEVTLRAATFLPITQAFVVPFKHFVDKVNAEGKGVLQIRVVGGPEAMPGFQQPNAVKTGVLDVAVVPSTYYKGQLFEVEALQLATKSFKEQRDTGVWDVVNKMHQERMNVVFLCIYGDNVGFHLYLSKKPTRPDRDGMPDLTGFKLRSAPVYEDFFKFLGASTVTIEGPEVTTALERGVVDGLGWPVLGLSDFGWQKYLKYRVDPSFYHTAIPIIVNLDKWKSLAQAQRDLLTNAGIWLETEAVRIFAELSQKDYKQQAAEGIQPLKQSADFAKKAEDVYWATLTKQSPDLIPQLREIMTK
jgi:TRAP-type C4-dicarboxylate transport system substrate-binding protein